MILWLVLAAMTAVVVALLVWPLARRGPAPPGRGEYDLAVYRDQLAELERDVARGLIADDEAEAAHAEIGRRMLAAADSVEHAATGERGPKSRPVWAMLVVVLVPAAATLLYLQAGAPNLADRPPARAGTEAAQATDTPPSARDAEIDTLLARLAERLAQRPDDAEGWALMGRTQFSMRRFQAAAEAFARASTLAPGDAALMARLAESLTFASDGTVTPRARTLFTEALEADATTVRARYYLGLADLQAGRRRAALDRWLALEGDAPEDARWLATLRPRIERLARELGLDLAALRRSRPSAPAGAAAPGPTAQDVEAASQMSGADRQAMIESMVARLAARLEDSPDNAEGWLRLARSYGVLGEAVKARDAFARVAALRPDDVAVQVGYANSIVRATPSDAPPPAAFAAVVARIRAIDPDNPDGLWLAGVVALADGRKADALRLWRRLLSGLPPGSPAHAALAERIAALQGE